jgi:hypothetical protein
VCCELENDKRVILGFGKTAGFRINLKYNHNNITVRIIINRINTFILKILKITVLDQRENSGRCVWIKRRWC